MLILETDLHEQFNENQETILRLFEPVGWLDALVLDFVDTYVQTLRLKTCEECVKNQVDFDLFEEWMDKIFGHQSILPNVLDSATDGMMAEANEKFNLVYDFYPHKNPEMMMAVVNGHTGLKVFKHSPLLVLANKE